MTTTFAKGYKVTLYSDSLRATTIYAIYINDPNLGCPRGQCEYVHYTLVFDNAQYQGATSMDIDVQNVQMHTRHNLPNRDAQGRPKCFYCHNYGHVRWHCRKLQQQSHKQQAEITMAELPRN